VISLLQALHVHHQATRSVKSADLVTTA
jgi:hypothetical protein